MTSGYISKALTTANVNPKPTPCFDLKASLYCVRKSKIGCMFTSLNVVNIAVSLFTATKRCATFLRNIDIFLRSVPLSPSTGLVPILGTAFSASFLVILPAFPVPFTVEFSIPFSAKIFFAAGEAVPVA